jgi:hypothetical protein
VVNSLRMLMVMGSVVSTFEQICRVNDFLFDEVIERL